ncbi:MAG: copper amine oxidase N-terminal domain-containing protein [Chlorobia bacterium]|nr:copper amine oxidase N-terminal domain-containing protein [Fimbriimonadaceae bacterium]
MCSAMALASSSGPVIKVNGKPVNFSGTTPQTVTGRMMVPVRGVFEAIGAYVEYSPVHHRVKARRANETIELRMGDKVANRNGAEIELDVAPMSIRGRMMVPLRFIAESLGADVNFTKATNTVDIFTDEDLPGVKPPPPAK